MSENIEKNCCRNEEVYYLNAIKRLEKSGEYTWNWAAFFFGGAWMAYRKMYLYAFLYTLVTWTLSQSVLRLISPNVYGESSVPLILQNIHSGFFWFVFGCLWLIESILTGYFGNALYYRTIKKKIQKGYHLLDQYHPTSISSIAFWPFICFADWISRRSQLKTEVEDEVNEETIQAYLNPNKKNHISVKIANFLTWTFFALVFVIPFVISFVHGVNQSLDRMRMQMATEREYSTPSPVFDLYKNAM